MASAIGPLHPKALDLVATRLLTWAEVKQLDPLPEVIAVTPHDLRAFQLPIPGVWKCILASEQAPGLAGADLDRSLPARTRVVGVLEPDATEVFLEEELLSAGLTPVRAGVLVANAHTISGFRTRAGEQALELRLDSGVLVDARSRSRWDLLGRPLSGPLASELEPLRISSEYWFSWRYWHPSVALTRVEPPALVFGGEALGSIQLG